MNHTERLMAAVRASLLLTGALPVLGATQPTRPTQPPGAAKDTTSEAWKTSPEVKAAAAQIYAWLAPMPVADAKTRSEIAAQFPTLAPLVDDAMKRLTQYELRIKQLGAGTDADPYRYYGHSVSGVD